MFGHTELIGCTRKVQLVSLCEHGCHGLNV